MTTITKIWPKPCSNSAMNIQRFMISFAVLAIAGSTNVYADDIYKWIDEDGGVHYEDRPSGAASEEILQFSYNRTSSTAVKQRIQTRHDVTATRREAREERDEEQRSAAETRAAAEEKLAKCQEYRQRMRTMLDSQRLYREDENGERVYLDDVAKAEARQQAEILIRENCSS